MNRLLTYAATALVVLATFLSHAPGGLARAGGGQSYDSDRPSSSGSSRSRSSDSPSSSGSSSSSSRPSSSTTSSSSGTLDTDKLAREGLLVLATMAVATVVGGSFMLLQRRRRGAGSREPQTYTRPAAAVAADEARDAMSRALHAMEPAGAEVFLAGSRAVFRAVQAAWSGGDLTPARRYLSDGVFERFDTLLALNAKRGIRNVVEDLEVIHEELVAVRSGQVFDAVTVFIRARCTDRDVRLDGAASAPPRKGAFEEHWTYVRRAGKVSADVSQSACPSCAAPLVLNQHTACSSCGAFVTSGDFGWVLAEITQTNAKRPKLTPDTESALAALRARDPSLSLEILEDRVSALFWRLRAKEPPRELGVGSVHLSQAEVGASRDRLTFDIVWTGDRTTKIVLERKAEARTSLARGMASLRCAGCGSPHTTTPRQGVETACANCGAPSADPSVDWVVAAVEEPANVDSVA